MYIFYFDWFEDNRIFCALLWKVVISFHLDIQIRYLLITICKKNFLNYLWIVHNYAADKSFLRLVKFAPSETVIQRKETRWPRLKPSLKLVQPCMKLHMRLLLHQFCLILLSERDESNKNNANEPSETVIQRYNERKLDGLDLSLVFLVSGASYEALYDSSFASVLFDFALRERWVKQN